MTMIFDLGLKGFRKSPVLDKPVVSTGDIDMKFGKIRAGFVLPGIIAAKQFRF